MMLYLFDYHDFIVLFVYRVLYEEPSQKEKTTISDSY